MSDRIITPPYRRMFAGTPWFSGDEAGIFRDANDDVFFAGPVLDLGGTVLNVKHPKYGAVGDGVTDDTAAIQAAIDAAEAIGDTPSNNGSVVFLPAGRYRTSSDLLIPQNVIFQGAGQAVTRVQALSGGTFTDGMLVLNPDGGFAVGLQVRDMQVHCASTAGRGILAKGLNEGCVLDGVHVLNPNTEGIRIEAGVTPTTNITQNVFFGQIRVTTPNAADVDALVLDNVRRCTFGALSLDVGSSGSYGFRYGIRMLGNCNGNLFLRTHVEDTLRPVEMGEDTPCQNNRFVGIHFTNPTYAPESRTIGSYTGTFGIVQIRTAGSTNYRNVIEQYSLNYDYDYDFVDAELDRVVESSDAIERFHVRICVSYDDAGNVRWDTDREASLPVVLTASLPAASALDNAILIEDGGTGDRNLVIYAGGQRFRIDGGAAF